MVVRKAANGRAGLRDAVTILREEMDKLENQAIVIRAAIDVLEARR